MNTETNTTEIDTREFTGEYFLSAAGHVENARYLERTAALLVKGSKGDTVPTHVRSMLKAMRIASESQQAWVEALTDLLWAFRGPRGK